MNQGPSVKKQKLSNDTPSSQPSPSTIKKANEVFEFMRSKRLSISDFISSIPYVGGNGRRQEIIIQNLFQNENVMMDLLFKKNYNVDFIPICNVLGIKLIQEIRQLQLKNDLFKKFEIDDKDGDGDDDGDGDGDYKKTDDVVSNVVDELEFDKSSIDRLFKQAPILTRLFNELLLNNQEYDKENEINDNDDNDGDELESRRSSNINRLVLIISIICYTRNKKKSTKLPILFGLYLNSLGLTKKRGLQIFNKFGISVNQKSINDLLDELSKKKKLNQQYNNGDVDYRKEIDGNGNEDFKKFKKSSPSTLSAGPLVLPFTQNIITSTNDGYKSTSEVLKLSDPKFSQLFDQYTNSSQPTTQPTATTTDNIDPKISNQIQQTNPH